MRSSSTIIVCVILALVSLAIGCGGEDTSQGQVPPPAQPATGAPLVPQPAVAPPAPAAAAAPVAATPQTVVPQVAGVPPLDPAASDRLGAPALQAAKDLNKQAMAQYKAKQYQAAVGLFIQALLQNPGHLTARYNLACTYNLMGQKNNAMALLGQFKATPGCGTCFKILARAAKDSDFDSLKADPAFQGLVAAGAAQMAQAMSQASWISLNQKALREDYISFDVTGLPAISSDGKRIALTYSSVDGNRGNPNLSLTIIDAINDRVVRNFKVLKAVEGDRPVAQLKPLIAKRIKKAHSFLVGKDWQKFGVDSGTVPYNYCGGEEISPFKVSNLSVNFLEPKLTVTNATGRKVVDRNFKGWSAKPRCGDGDKPAGYPNCELPCANDAFVSRGYLWGSHHVLLLVVDYCGNVTV